MNLAEAKAKFSEAVNRAEAGETIEITRRGKVAARLVPPEPVREKIDLEELRRLRATMPEWSHESGVCFVQWARENDQL